MTGAAVVLAGEAGVRAGAIDAWLADEAARAVVDEASAVVGRDVATWWRDPLALSCDTTAAHVEVVPGRCSASDDLAGPVISPAPRTRLRRPPPSP